MTQDDIDRKAEERRNRSIKSCKRVGIDYRIYDAIKAMPGVRFVEISAGEWPGTPMVAIEIETTNGARLSRRYTLKMITDCVLSDKEIILPEVEYQLKEFFALRGDK